MKARVVGSVSLCLLLVGCGEKSEQTVATTNAPPSGSSPLTAPVDYLGAIGKAKQNAVKTADIAQINQAIQMYNTEHGKNPKALNELVEEKYLPRIPAAPYGM